MIRCVFSRNYFILRYKRTIKGQPQFPRQQHQELTKSLTEEIKELEEQKVLKLEELKQREQQAVADYDKTTEILDAYEEKCAEVVKALKRATNEEYVAADSEAAAE